MDFANYSYCAVDVKIRVQGSYLMIFRKEQKTYFGLSG